MRDHENLRAQVIADDFQQSWEGPGRDGKTTLTMNGGKSEGILIPGSSLVGILRFDFAASKPLPMPMRDFAESITALYR